MSSTLSLDQVIKIRQKLDNIIRSEVPNKERALDLLKAIQDYNITLDVLQKSGLSVTVNKLRHTLVDVRVTTLAKKLIQSWKVLLSGDSKTGHSSKTSTTSRGPVSLPQISKKSHRVIKPYAYTGSSQNSSPKPVPSSLKPVPSSPKPVTSSPKPVTSSPKLVTSSPKPVTSSPKLVTSSPKPVPSSSKPVTSSPKPVPTAAVSLSNSVPQANVGGSTTMSNEERTSSLESEVVELNFSSNIDGLECSPSTGCDVRDRCRELLVKALRKGFETITVEEEYKFYNLGSKIEECVFENFTDTGNKYKLRVRSLVSNLGDLKNVSFRQHVITGEITPPEIAVMTAEEMASDSMKKLREQLTKEAIRDAQVALTDGAGGAKCDLLRCPECGKNNCSYTQAQTLQSDEPMTTFAYCNDCGHRWVFY